MTACAGTEATQYRPQILYMPKEVADYFRKNQPDEPTKKWLKNIVVQQCLNDEFFYGKKCYFPSRK